MLNTMRIENIIENLTQFLHKTVDYWKTRKPELKHRERTLGLSQSQTSKQNKIWVKKTLAFDSKNKEKNIWMKSKTNE